MFLNKGKVKGRDIQAIFVMEPDGTDYVLAPDGSPMDESSLTPRMRETIRHQRKIPAETRTRIFLRKR